MPEVNLRSIDLNLLTTFAAVFEEGSQARAAMRLGISQPAVSNAMTRMADVVHARLFIAGAGGVVPTPAAQRLYPRVHKALALIRAGIADERKFDPLVTERTFTMAIGYGGGTWTGPKVLAWIAEAAPKAMLKVGSIRDQDSIVLALRSGTVDLAIDYVEPRDPELLSTQLKEQAAVVIVRRGHPRLRGRITRAQLESEKLAVATQHHPPGSVPELKSLQFALRHNAVIELPTALALPAVVAATDLFAIVGARVAAIYAEPLGLVVHKLPYAIPPLRTWLYWHESHDSDVAQRWFRQGVRRALAQ